MATLVLFDQIYDGLPRKGVAAHSKQRWLFLLDRVTGQPLVPVETVSAPGAAPRTAATQPVPVGDPTAPQRADPLPGFVQGCMFTPFWNDNNIAQPAASADWAPGSFNPKTGFMYVTAGVSTRVFRTGTEELVDGRPVSIGSGRWGPLGSREYGMLTAIDTRTGRAAWKQELPGLYGFGSRTLTTGCGLVFHGEPTGEFMARDTQTGEILWKFHTGFGADAPAATYMIDGEQYVAIAAGGSRDRLNEARGDLVWAFKLGGRLMPLNGPPAPDKVISFDSVTTGATQPVTTDTVTISYPWDTAANALGGRRSMRLLPNARPWLRVPPLPGRTAAIRSTPPPRNEALGTPACSGLADPPRSRSMRRAATSITVCRTRGC